MSKAGLNLKYLRKLRGWTQEEFAQRLNVKRSLIGAYEEERADPRIELLEQVAQLFKLTLDELLLKDLSVSMQTGNYLQKRRMQKMAVVDRNLIHFVPVKAAAGYLTSYADSEFIDELNTFTLPMLTGGQFRAFEIIGDSMLPTPSGSIIVGEKIDSVDEVKNGAAYIVVSKNEGIVYKRIQKNSKAKTSSRLRVIIQVTIHTKSIRKMLWSFGMHRWSLVRWPISSAGMFIHWPIWSITYRIKSVL